MFILPEPLLFNAKIPPFSTIDLYVPDKFIVDAVSQGQIYKQFGNSVCVKVIEAIAKQIIDVLAYKTNK